VDLSVNEFPSGVSATASANLVTQPANGSVNVDPRLERFQTRTQWNHNHQADRDFRSTHQRDTRYHNGGIMTAV
jgi:hypothetical protein